jgi:hypothetical protein
VIGRIDAASSIAGSTRRSKGAEMPNQALGAACREAVAQLLAGSVRRGPAANVRAAWRSLLADRILPDRRSPSEDGVIEADQATT